MHDVERAIGRIAARQHDVIHREQLLAAGLGRGAIAHRLRAGTLQRLYCSVYLVGYAPPTPAARIRAALMASGDRAFLSHRAAAYVWQLLPLPEGAPVDVTIVGRNVRSKPGLRTHRVQSLDAADHTRSKRLPLTTVARTITDLAATESATETERALDEARARRLLSGDDLESALARRPHRPGAKLLRTILSMESGVGPTRSPAERILLPLIREAQLPLPRVNVPVCGYLVDLCWPEQRLVVEADGYKFHSSRAKFEEDRRRDQALVAAGYRVIRVTWRQMTTEPYAVIARIAQALVASAA